MSAGALPTDCKVCKLLLLGSCTKLYPTFCCSILVPGEVLFVYIVLERFWIFFEFVNGFVFVISPVLFMNVFQLCV